MKDQGTHHRFIELRVQGWSLARIASEIHVSKRTLVEWNRQFQNEITELKGVELEALQERILTSHEEELQRLAAHLNRIEGVLAKRNLDCLSTESLFCLAATVRSQLRRQCAALPLNSAAKPSVPLSTAPDSSQLAA